MKISSMFPPTFDNSCVGHDPSTIDVIPVSVVIDAQRVAGAPHLVPAARAARRPRRNSQGSRYLPEKRMTHISQKINLSQIRRYTVNPK